VVAYNKVSRDPGQEDSERMTAGPKVAGATLFAGAAVIRGQAGQALLEYAILAAVLSIAAVTLVAAIGGYLPSLFSHVVPAL